MLLTWHWIVPQRMSWRMSRPLRGPVPHCPQSLRPQTKGKSFQKKTKKKQRNIPHRKCDHLRTCFLGALCFSEFSTCTARPLLWQEHPACRQWRPATFPHRRLSSRTTATTITQQATCQVNALVLASELKFLLHVSAMFRWLQTKAPTKASHWFLFYIFLFLCFSANTDYEPLAEFLLQFYFYFFTK